ncbi:hypothetical protein [Methylocaldum gracile]|jgi:IS4 transposase|uniref:hypothetical protein n=1 Tax=Methylocaldum sp. 0917 TaxID=2485163 RepID=UPI00105BEA40
MKKKRLALSAITLLLSASALSGSFISIRDHQHLNIPYLIFGIIGFSGGILTAVRLSIGRQLVMVFIHYRWFSFMVKTSLSNWIPDSPYL